MNERFIEERSCFCRLPHVEGLTVQYVAHPRLLCSLTNADAIEEIRGDLKPDKGFSENTLPPPGLLGALSTDGAPFAVWRTTSRKDAPAVLAKSNGHGRSAVDSFTFRPIDG